MKTPLINFMKTKRAYRALFLDEHGQLKPDAITVLDDLYSFCCMSRPASSVEPQMLAAVEGSRKVVLHVLKQIKQLSAEQSRRIHQGVYDNE